MKSYGVTTQTKPLKQYFHMVLFILKYFAKQNLQLVLNWLIDAPPVSITAPSSLDANAPDAESTLVEDSNNIYYFNQQKNSHLMFDPEIKQLTF